MLRRPAVRFGAAAIVTVLVAELAVRVMAPYLEPPLRFPTLDAQVKVERYLVERAAGRATTVYVGSSVTATAVDPDIVGRGAFNFGISGAEPTAFQLLVPLLAQRPRPRLAVLEVSPVPLNDAAPLPLAPSLRASDGYRSAAGAQDRLGRIDDLAGDRSELVRRRGQLQRPGLLIAGARALLAGRRYRPLEVLDMTPRGYRDLGPGRLPAAPAVRGATYRAGGRQTDALLRTARRLEALCIDVVFVSYPVDERELRAHQPAVAAGLDQFQVVLRRVEAGGALVRLQPSRPWTRADFRDHHHLSGQGARAVSALLAGAPQLAGRARPRCGR